MKNKTTQKEKQNKRFKVMSKEKLSDTSIGFDYSIIKDTTTNVLYVANFQNVVTLLVDRDGKPLVDDSDD